MGWKWGVMAEASPILCLPVSSLQWGVMAPFLCLPCMSVGSLQEAIVMLYLVGFLVYSSRWPGGDWAPSVCNCQLSSTSG